MSKEPISLSKALTKKGRLFGTTTGRFKGEIANKVIEGTINPLDKELGIIRKKIFGFVPVCFTTADKPPKGFNSLQEFEQAVKSEKESILQNIQNGFDLYDKILQANAEKMIKIGDVEMSIAAAIIYRDQIIPIYRDLVTFLRNHLKKVHAQAEDNDNKVKESAEHWLKNELQSGSKTDADRINRMRSDYLQNKLSKISDPIDIQKWIEELEKKIDTVEGELQMGIYNSNISTMIYWTPSE